MHHRRKSLQNDGSLECKLSDRDMWSVGAYDSKVGCYGVRTFKRGSVNDFVPGILPAKETEDHVKMRQQKRRTMYTHQK